MELFRFNLRLLASTGSLWQSDTLFGHLCWQLVFRDGEAALQEFLEPFLQGAPPFVLSDGFPAGLMPRPLLQDKGDTVSVSVEEYAAAKRLRKARFLAEEQFNRLRAGETITALVTEGGWMRTETLHAALDRNTMRTGGEGSEGQLFQTESWIPQPVRPSGAGQQAESLEDGCQSTGKETPNLQVYARATAKGLEQLRELMTILAKVGYGRDKCTGSGQFRIFDVERLEGWDALPNANGFVSLSSFVPAAGDPVQGAWRLRIKRGMLGESRARGTDPVKRPLIQFEPGSVFKTPSQPRPWYGRIVRGLSPAYPDVIQSCQTVAIPLFFDN